ncbi:hypothetical protein [Methanobrevibacter olleyae]|uniref:Uncharacterized protein n=1 Tax=Methanobrevibacter olleyae TaxID=294671 RepID=A0A126R2M9_METOL|nr:hypothetical protein [Methanobrevibacter olleyae]AMK16308.1 hypothetical protein YLM1_1753 [Methanobrevibacter olleyae]
MSGQSARTLGKQSLHLHKEYESYCKALRNKIMRKLPLKIRQLIEFPYPNDDYRYTSLFFKLWTSSFGENLINNDDFCHELKKMFSEAAQIDSEYIELDADYGEEYIDITVDLKGYSKKKYILMEYE